MIGADFRVILTDYIGSLRPDIIRWVPQILLNSGDQNPDIFWTTERSVDD